VPYRIATAPETRITARISNAQPGSRGGFAAKVDLRDQRIPRGAALRYPTEVRVASKAPARAWHLVSILITPRLRTGRPRLSSCEVASRWLPRLSRLSWEPRIEGRGRPETRPLKIGIIVWVTSWHTRIVVGEGRS